MYHTAGAEMVNYLAKSIRLNAVTEPINSGKIRYYSVMNDGSSSSKTMDEKELFLIKTARSGITIVLICNVVFYVLVQDYLCAKQN